MNFINESVIKSIIILVLCLLLCYFSKIIVKKFFPFNTNKIKEKRQKTIVNLISNVIRVFIIVICGTIILEEYGIDTKSFIASVGVFSLVIGLALQDLLKDIIAGISIIFERLFDIGDWVQIGEFNGEVIATGLRTTKLKSYTGAIKLIYNRNIVDVINYSMDITTSIIDVQVAYDSNLDKVEKVINDLCEELKNNKIVRDIECLGVEELEDSGLKYRIIVKSNYSNSFAISRNIKRKIITIFNKNNIIIPYKQVVIHDAKL